jgi:hypothetical protein
MNFTINDTTTEMAQELKYDISFNKAQSFTRFEQGLITKILAEIVAMNGDITTLLETEYNQIQVIHGIHASKGETQEHFTMCLFNHFGFAERSGMRRTAKGASGLFHVNLDDAFNVTSITMVQHMRLRK